MADTPWDSIDPFAGGLTKDMEFIVKVGDKNYKIPLSNITLSEVDTSDAKKNLPLNSSAVNGALADLENAPTILNIDEAYPNSAGTKNYMCIDISSKSPLSPEWSLVTAKVVKNEAGTATWINQKCEGLGSNLEYIRQGYFTPQHPEVSWSDWVKIATKSDFVKVGNVDANGNISITEISSSREIISISRRGFIIIPFVYADYWVAHCLNLDMTPVAAGVQLELNITYI